MARPTEPRGPDRLRHDYPDGVTSGIRSTRSAAGPLLAVALGGALLLAGCTGAQAKTEPAEPRKLSASQAGGAYLEAVCPVNTAWGEADLEIDRLRLTLDRGDADPSGARSALRTVGQASGTAADALDPKRNEWPKAAAPAIAKVRETLVADQKELTRVEKLDAKKLADYSWQGGEAAGAAAADARNALKLPDDPAFACSEWADQHGSKGAKKSKESPAKDGSASDTKGKANG